MSNIDFSQVGLAAQSYGHDYRNALASLINSGQLPVIDILTMSLVNTPIIDGNGDLAGFVAQWEDGTLTIAKKEGDDAVLIGTHTQKSTLVTREDALRLWCDAWEMGNDE